MQSPSFFLGFFVFIADSMRGLRRKRFGFGRIGNGLLSSKTSALALAATSARAAKTTRKRKIQHELDNRPADLD